MSNQFKTIKKSGDWELKEFTVTAEDEKVEIMRAMFQLTAGMYRKERICNLQEAA